VLVSVTTFIILNLSNRQRYALLLFNQVAAELHVGLKFVENFYVDVVSRNFSLDAVHNFHFFFLQKLNELSKHGFVLFSHLTKLLAFSLHHISKHWLLRIVFLCLDVFFDSVFGPLVKRSNYNGLNLFIRLFIFSLWIRLVFFDKFSFFY